MNKNDWVEKYARTPDDKMMLARVIDKMEETRRKNIPTSTHFLNENQRAVAEKLIQNCGNQRHAFYGGYTGAERTVLFFLPDYIEAHEISNEASYTLSAIRVEYSKTNTPSHRDFLGSIMGLGVKRETIGDILVDSGHGDIVVLKGMLPYIVLNLESVGRIKVRATEIAVSKIRAPEPVYKSIRSTVASLRVDNVVSTGFSISREKSASEVKSGKVFVNHIECSKVDKSITEGDVITLRGMGKIELCEIGHRTRKGRLSIRIKRYM